MGTEELYLLYKEFQKLKVIKELDRINFLMKEKNILIEARKAYVKTYSDYKGRQYYLEYNTIEMPNFPVKENVSIIDEALKVTKDLFEELVAINLEIAKLQETVSLHHNNKITLKIYSDVIRMFNQKIIEQIVRGYVLKMGCLGDIRVVKKERKGKNVDWGTSISIKNQLKESGKTPLKYDYDEDGNLINNGGEPWMVYFTSDTAYWLIWDRRYQSFFDVNKFPLFPFYNVKFTKGEHEKGAIMRLVRTWQNDKFIHLRYTKR